MFIFPILKKQFFVIIISFLVIFSSITGFITLPSISYYGGIALSVFLVLLNAIGLRTHSKYVVLFLLSCFLSLLFNSPPDYFKAWQRYGVYLIVLLAASPIFVSKKINNFRFNLFYIQLSVNAVLSVGSFFAYFLGVNFFVRNNEFLEIRAGSFSGLLNHSMVLGPIAGVSSLFFLSLIFNTKFSTYKHFFVLGVFFCFGATLLAASRMALLSTIIGFVVALFCHYRRSVARYLKNLFIIFVLSLITFPFWSQFTNFVLEKQSNNIESGSMFYSRRNKIEARINEFLDSPLFGIGFCCVNPTYDVVDRSSGQIEPGSSWLSVASMTGLLGLVSFLSIIFHFLKKAYNFKNSYYSMLFTSILIFFIFHMAAEGYILAPGNYVNYFFWLLLGAISAYDYKEKHCI